MEELTDQQKYEKAWRDGAGWVLTELSKPEPQLAETLRVKMESVVPLWQPSPEVKPE